MDLINYMKSWSWPRDRYSHGEGEQWKQEPVISKNFVAFFFSFNVNDETPRKLRGKNTISQIKFYRIVLFSCA